MKTICFVSAGDIPVPPSGWGALETVVWGQAKALERLGYNVHIVNNPNTQEVFNEIESVNPDIVHLHYGKHYQVLPYIHRKKIITNHNGNFLNDLQFHEQIIRQFMYDCEFFNLTTWEVKLLKRIGFPDNKIKIIPNGVNTELFNVKDQPENNKSICLGKIDSRKRQAELQKLKIEIDFVGANNDPSFDPMQDNFLGIWTREDVYQNLTNYLNLVLLSQAELQPLVCLEGLSAGLGLVISEASAQNLDTSLDFISVIPQNKLEDTEYIKQTILANKEICKNTPRSTITEYAKSFDWNNIAKLYQNNIL